MWKHCCLMRVFWVWCTFSLLHWEVKLYFITNKMLLELVFHQACFFPKYFQRYFIVLFLLLFLQFYLQDTKSSNGTFINSQRLSRGSEESPPCEIMSGDIIQFGVDVTENTRKGKGMDHFFLFVLFFIQLCLCWTFHYNLIIKSKWDSCCKNFGFSYFFPLRWQWVLWPHSKLDEETDLLKTLTLPPAPARLEWFTSMGPLLLWLYGCQCIEWKCRSSKGGSTGTAHLAIASLNWFTALLKLLYGHVCSAGLGFFVVVF